MRWLFLVAAISLSGCAEYAKAYRAVSVGPSSSTAGQTVYSASECIGAIVNSVCQGTILPQTAVHPVCHGEMIGGQCTGPMF